MPAENIAMRDSLLGNGVLQCTCDVLLPDDIGKTLRSVLSGEDLITHGWDCVDYTYLKPGG